MLELYVMDSCPYCRKVMDYLNEHNINFQKKEIGNSENHRKLLELGGVDQVPFMVDENTKMYESSDIIDYINQNYL